MSERKLIIEVGIDDDAVNSIEDLEREILAQDICGQAARKYLDSLQDDMAQQAKVRKGSKKIHIKTPHFEFNFQAKRVLNGMGKKRS
uniref:Uncharacterized protein n=1 Tax=Candidatus Methanogaster sp. ANME-2c ERB4 TaxID=2759911 RepID=A0A7G9Y8F2_9EURY|nr:hypothetical protein EMJGOPNH_00004 [Methanosarcinales archaeon ANME-2c ERB4]QNO44731.1 hypothetical protein PCCCHLLA_00006 [Methanosarcinales archaeon ANME-2c ERB4]QNO49549.1 hypothetical protein HIGBABBE_00022 [Methanosarcinales archaeon ANME-2c ERB4]